LSFYSWKVKVASAFWRGAEFKPGGDFGAEVGGDQVVFGDFAGVDVEAVADFGTTAT
jgi:hypothetical protein